MKQVVILGAGGLGRQALAQLQIDRSHGVDWVISGFIDERGPDVVPDHLYYPWLGFPKDFIPSAEQVFVVAIGDTYNRERQVLDLLNKGADFISVRTRTELGVRTSYGATFFGYDVSSGVDCKIGSFGFIDQQTMLGHDVVISDFVHIAPRCLLAGYVKVGKNVVINSGAMIAKGVCIGDNAVVGMGAIVFKDIPPGATVVGNPAKIIYKK